MAKTLWSSKAKPALRSAAKRADESYGQTAQPDWRKINWRRHLHWADVEGKQVNYVDIGSGEGDPLVFVHGLSGTWQNWLENLPFFAQKRRCIAMDLPGFGFSEMPQEKISMTGYARQVDTLCKQLDIDSYVVIGNSMGGFVGAELAIRCPERVKRLNLVAAAGISITNLHRRPTLTSARIIAAAGASTAAQRRTMVTRPVLRQFLGFVFRHPGRIKTDLLYEQTRGAGAPGFVDALDALTSYDFRDRIPEIKCPTLIVWGKQDMLVPVEDAHEYERLIPESRTILLEDTGHVPMLERPVKFNECLDEFIEARGAGAETGPEERVTTA